MAIKIKARGIPEFGDGIVIGRVTRKPIEFSFRKDYIKIVSSGSDIDSCDGYAAILIEDNRKLNIKVPYVNGYDDLSFLKEGCIVQVNLQNGFMRVLYRPGSSDNVLFTTERCNNNCLMCSQPPKNVDDGNMPDFLIRLVDLIPDVPMHIGISGGEPTLLGYGLLKIIRKLKNRFPNTAVTMLSNARRYIDEKYVQAISEINHNNFLTSVPLYSNCAGMHDFIVQKKGAFDQTILGLYNATRYGLPIEVRVVLHKQTTPNLLALSEYIYRNLPFITGIVFMGLENMGYVKRNWNLLWEDPVDYAEKLEQAVEYLHLRNMNVFIYNLPLCVLPESLWGFAKQSISEFKRIYPNECESCSVKTYCGGIFQSSTKLHSRGLKPIQ